MGIDIRNGQQLACITCGLCIDACNEVMDKIGKPRGLIGYLALSDEQAERAGKAPKPVWKHVFRPRTILYTVLWGGVGIGLIAALFLRTDLDLAMSPIRNPIYVQLADGSIRNDYDLRIRNMHNEARTFYVMVDRNPSLTLTMEGRRGLLVTVPADEMLIQRLYLTAGAGTPAARSERTEVRIWVSDVESRTRASVDTIFNGRAE
jgi:polyferredoxin